MADWSRSDHRKMKLHDIFSKKTRLPCNTGQHHRCCSMGWSVSLMFPMSHQCDGASNIFPHLLFKSVILLRLSRIYHYTTLHCTTLHYTTLHYTTLHLGHIQWYLMKSASNKNSHCKLGESPTLALIVSILHYLRCYPFPFPSPTSLIQIDLINN